MKTIHTKSPYYNTVLLTKCVQFDFYLYMVFTKYMKRRTTTETKKL